MREINHIISGIAKIKRSTSGEVVESKKQA